MKKRTKFTLEFQYQQDFDFLSTYSSPMSDDTGRVMRFKGEVWLVEISHCQGNGTTWEKFPWKYSFDKYERYERLENPLWLC